MPGHRKDHVSAQNAQPLYVQVAARLAADIAEGELRPGQRLPSERELVADFGVSRVTLRQALSMLVEQGLVTSSAGRGWFVEQSLNEPPGALVSFSEMAASRGLHPTAKVLDARVRSATLDEAEALDIMPGAGLFALQRLRLIDGVAIAIDHSRLPHRLVPEIEHVDFTTASLHAVLKESFGLVPTRADYRVEATAANVEEAALLGVEDGTPLLDTTQTTYDQTAQRIELGSVTYRGDRYRFRAILLAQGADATAGVLSKVSVAVSDNRAAGAPR